MSGFKLFEISSLLQAAIVAAESHVDPETGEIPEDWGQFLDDVQLERDTKALDTVCYLKNIGAEAEALRVEAARLLSRAKAIDNKYDATKNWLAAWLKPGEKLSNSRAAISWRKSKSVVITDEKALPQSVVRIILQPMKTEIKELIEREGSCPGAEIKENLNLQIK